jgi:glycosyltransferase involved in cell wall biosynthesis
MAEALACGTPVIGFRRGSVPEVVRNGVTGWIVDDLSGMVSALGRIGELDRTACRRDAEIRFSEDAVVNAYEALYLKS